MKPIILSIPVDIYGADIAVHIINDTKYADRLAKTCGYEEGKDGEGSCEQNNGITIAHDSGSSVVWLRYVPNSPSRYATLTHEVEHAANGILRSRGIILTEETDEVSA